MNGRRLWLGAWLSGALAIAGCGGGGSDEPRADVGQSLEAAPTDAATAPDAASVAADAGEAAPSSERFELGTHYDRLSPAQPTSSSPEQVEVAEVFWYGCPHCYAFDPYLKRWLASGKPEYVSFIRIPAVWNPLLELHARAFYTAEALGKGAEMHDAFFREIHENHDMLDSEEKLQAFFAKFGVDAAAFKQAFESFEVHSKLERANELNRRYRISSVPTIVVNGKYTTDPGQAGGYDQVFELIDELVTAEHAGQ